MNKILDILFKAVEDRSQWDYFALYYSFWVILPFALFGVIKLLIS